MNWNKIKTFLILLFTIINLYLILSTSGNVLIFESLTRVDKETVRKTSQIIKNNYGITLDTSKVPDSIKNLNIIDVTNYIYSDEFEKTKDYNVSTENSVFKLEIDTDTYSYNEKSARPELEKVLLSLGFSPEETKTSFSMTDSGLVAKVYTLVSEIPIFNSSVTAEFSPRKIIISGRWYIPDSDNVYSNDNTLRMTDITSVLIDASDRASELKSTKIENIVYGYYVSSYDEGVVTKISSAVPCYMIETDNVRFLYDAIDGKFIKQEDI